MGFWKTLGNLFNLTGSRPPAPETRTIPMTDLIELVSPILGDNKHSAKAPDVAQAFQTLLDWTKQGTGHKFIPQAVFLTNAIEELKNVLAKSNGQEVIVPLEPLRYLNTYQYLLDEAGTKFSNLSEPVAANPTYNPIDTNVVHIFSQCTHFETPAEGESFSSMRTKLLACASKLNSFFAKYDVKPLPHIANDELNRLTWTPTEPPQAPIAPFRSELPFT